jgi:hypothetical protein
MRWFVLLPGSLVPAPLAADIVDATAAPRLSRSLLQASRAPDESVRDAPIGAAYLSWLWRAFCGDGVIPVTAPYAWRALSHASTILPNDTSQWWHCDPIHVEVGRDRLIVGRSRDAQLSESEADALALEADAVLRAHGALLKRLRHDAWFVETDHPWRLDTAPLMSARAQSLGPCLPMGAEAARWRKILTDIQVRWHHHAVNHAREERGQPPVNGIWLHGGGVWTPLPRAPFASIVSNDPVLRGWALAAGAAPSALLDEGAVPQKRGDAVSVWTDLQEPASFESWGVWQACLGDIAARLERLRARAFDAGFESIELVLTGRQVIRVLSLRQRDRLRFWRRGVLGPLLAEPIDT